MCSYVLNVSPTEIELRVPRELFDSFRHLKPVLSRSSDIHVGVSWPTSGDGVSATFFSNPFHSSLLPMIALLQPFLMTIKFEASSQLGRHTTKYRSASCILCIL